MPALEDDPAYQGSSRAIHVENGVTDPSVTPAGTSVDDSAPAYAGQSPSIISTDLSPDQFHVETITGPVPKEESYVGVSDAIHVFGDDAPVFTCPDGSAPPCTIPACDCPPGGGFVDSTLPSPYYDDFNRVRTGTGTWGEFSSGSIFWRSSFGGGSVDVDGDEGVMGTGTGQQMSFVDSGFPMDFFIFENGLFSDWLFEGIRVTGTAAHPNIWLMTADNGTYQYIVILYPNDAMIYVERITNAGGARVTLGSLVWTPDKIRIQSLDGNQINVGTGPDALFGLSIDITASPIYQAKWGYIFFGYDVNSWHYTSPPSGDGLAYINNVSGYYTPEGAVVGGGGGGSPCDECDDPENPGTQIQPFTPGFMPTFRRQIGDPTTSLDSFICTMESAAMVLDWHTRHGISVWGGELIPWCGKTEAEIRGDTGHPGTSLANAQQAWTHFGQVLEDWTGGTWANLIAALQQGRAVVLQGDYGTFTDAEKCQTTFEGNHAVSVYPYEVSGRLLVGDPLCHDFKGILGTDLQAYAEAFGAQVFGVQSPQPILFAVSRPWVP